MNSVNRIRFSSELLEEPQVVSGKKPDVVDLILQHRNPLDAHAEREPAYFLGVVTDGFEDIRVDHSRTENFDPARALADAAVAALAGTAKTADVHLGTR